MVEKRQHHQKCPDTDQPSHQWIWLWERPIFLRRALALAVIASPFWLITSAAAEVIDVTLLQLNDVYEITPVEGGKRGGLARVAGLRSQLLAENPHTYTLMAGDFLSPSALGTARINGERLAGAQMVAVLNTLGLDFATFGNHEFDISETQFYQRLEEAEFQWISSNVRDRAAQPLPHVAPSQMLTIEGTSGETVAIGLLGVTLDSNSAAYVSYLDPIETAQMQVAQLQAQGADVIVALTHLSLAEDQQLIAAVPGIDLVLGGHEHENVQQWRIGDRPNPAANCAPFGVPIFKADANARTVYVHRLRYDTDTGCLSIDSVLQPITATTPVDTDTEAVVATWVERGFQGFRSSGFEPEAVVAVLRNRLDGLEASVRNRPTGLTQLIAEAMLQAAPEADLAMYNSGSIRIDDQLPPGDISQYDIIRILPFGGEVLTVKMTGRLLQQVLDQGNANRGTGGYLQTANVVQGDDRWMVQGNAVDPTRRYRVAINDFLVSGQEQGLDFLSLDSPDVTVIENHGDIRFAVIKTLQAQGSTR